jgi:hypothetical protein
MPRFGLKIFPCAVPLAKETPSPPGWRGGAPLANNDDLIWGCPAIAAEILKSVRQTYYLLEHGLIPARKIGSRWIASRAELRAFFPHPPH